MATELTWRDLVDRWVRRMKAPEKEEFAHALGVSMTTINRWRRGKDRPNADNLERLLAAFPDIQREQLLILMQRDPRVWPLLPPDVQASVPQDEPEAEAEAISFLPRPALDHFALTMLRLQRDTTDRFWQLSGAILREAVKRLETHPHQTGLEVLIATCMPPRQGKIKSLRRMVAMGTDPWRGDLHMQEGFLGIESVAGRAIARRHGDMVPDLAAQGSPIWDHERSAAAFPIMYEHRTAGALVVVSTQPEYFTPARMELIEIFADMIRLAFKDDDFYGLSEVDLAVMPEHSSQQALFTSFRSRVDAEYQRASKDASLQELIAIEETVWAQFEAELLMKARSREDTLV